MNTGLRITAFAAAIVATFGTAYGVGASIDPVVAEKPPAAHDEHAEAGGEEAGEKTEDGHGEGHDGGSAEGGAASATAGGLQMSEGGYTLALDTPRVAAGKPATLRFSVKDDGGRSLTSYEREHGKELHFIVASRDLTVYRHLHPTRAADGTWSVVAEFPAAGGYRAFADFKPAKKDATGITLGTDLAVSGKSEPAALPPVRATAEVDGYRVTLDGALAPGKARELTLSVSRNGEPVTDLQPYLGAYGHLVALRAGDLAYLHVHPNGEPDDGVTEPGPEVSFTATAPSAGAYRLFLDFQHKGEVRTAAFTVDVPAAGAGESKESEVGEKGESHGH
ncbi:hypothetical protein [Streptomyces sp. IB2014 016-6]|uniref:hypothetical protein n=1 Tax=Streptomyces sp. IB2014 016-6 TaxID=2517818 RepID=UPI0011CBE4C7|nr:hypothetical protein [Streptomyces sp. IB2014 016-6]TXL89528.1 hypothetical protein EW053_14515 [Streptomyces sp. IB2014 016-6]